MGHSIRQGKRVLKTEKYLGTFLPKNIALVKEEFFSELRYELYAKLERIRTHFQAEWKRIPISAQAREKEEVSIAFTYNTNAIEGSTITLAETREIIQDGIAPHKLLGDIKETESHSKVFLKMLDCKEKISHGLLLEWHKDIFGETKSDIAGKYRDYVVRIGPYRAPDWQDVPNLMDVFIQWVYSHKSNAVELAARVHYRFEKIHPFGDGNGRIGRLLLNSILWHQGYPMLIIEYKNRRSYYKAFDKDEDHFVNYMVRRYMAAHGKRWKG